MDKRLMTLAVTGSLIVMNGTASEAAEGTLPDATLPTTTQSLAISPSAKPEPIKRDGWKATTPEQLSAIKRAAEARKAAAEKAAAAKKAAAEKAAAAKKAADAKAAAAKAKAAVAAAAKAAGWRFPLSGHYTSFFGPRPQPIPGVNPFHAGLDIAAPCGRTVVAAKSGRVIQAGWSGTYGNWILIQHDNGVQTGYAHSSSMLVGVGQRVSAGQAIARVGMTGAATGCHLHWEVRTNAGPINPLTFMSANIGR